MSAFPSHSDDEWWWCRDRSIKSIATSLSETFAAIVDDFLPAEELHNVQTEITGAYDKGLLSHQGLTGGGADAAADEAVRGDLIGFFESKLGAAHDQQLKEGWGEGKALTRALEKMNTIVCELRDAHLPELKTVTTRSRAMVTCYPGQRRRYTKHCDNAVRNGRKLTAILYLNQNWTDTDGGELKIYPNYTTEQIKASYDVLLRRMFGFDSNTCAVVDSAVTVRPVANRLVLFWSDMRCPHEVLPTARERFAVTLWFIDGKERDETAAITVAAAAEAARRKVQEEELRLKMQQEKKDAMAAAQLVPSCSESGETEDIQRDSTTTSTTAHVTLLLSDHGENAVWNANDRCLLYTLQVSGDRLVQETLVDVVNKNVLFIHSASHSFAPIEIPIVLPSAELGVIQESKTTAKYSKKKKILSVRLYFD